MGQMKEYKCPNCGGAIVFDTNSQKAKCPYCDTEFDISVFEQLSELEAASSISSDEPTWDTDAGTQWGEAEEGSMKVFSCNACGGEIITDNNTAALRCPYCNNPVIFTGNLSGTLKPNYIIPFKLDKKAAKKRYEEHIKGKALLPPVFKDQNHIDEIKGVYVPFWLFDGKAEGEARFRGTRVRMWDDSEYTYTETRFYEILRGGDMSFEKIPVDGSTQMPDDLMESLEPYDYSAAVDFKTAYLAGYMADKYDVTAEDSKDRAANRIRNSVMNYLRNSVSGYNTLEPQQDNFQLYNSSASYALLPVWILNTTWNGQKYTFAMNGQTGKFVGNLPMDKGLYWKNFATTSVVSTIVMFLIMTLLGLFVF